jgi:hypothetical protein
MVKAVDTFTVRSFGHANCAEVSVVLVTVTAQVRQRVSGVGSHIDALR